MQALPTVVALVVAIVLTPRILQHLSAEGLTRENWRGVALPFPGGIAIVAAGVLALGICSALVELAHWNGFAVGGLGLTYLLGVALLGLVDDLLAGSSRGWRGHGRAVLDGGFSTGALKAVGALALALYELQGESPDRGEYLLAVALLVLTTNLFNLLDLRPGRSVKAFVLLGAGLSIGAWHGRYGYFVPLWIVGPLAAPVVVVGLYDLRERTMLGDTGANLIGGLAGLWMVLTLGTLAQAIALAVVLLLTIYGEFRSLSVLISWMPLLREIDSAGRNDADA